MVLLNNKVKEKLDELGISFDVVEPTHRIHDGAGGFLY